ncbi:MAG: hypothetical protein K0S55_890 [Clostridia bacterium]|nr:hypothetical protein [Clostridia bacterium]
MIERWVGIDIGYSQMTIAIIDAGINIIALECTREPFGDGHNREVAISRLRILLQRLSYFKNVPVRIAGYCYGHSGVLEEFKNAGWTVDGFMALNDVVGFYGLTDMKGHAIIGGCGSFSQVVYVDVANNVYWPGDDVKAKLPRWMLSGWDYATFLLGLTKQSVSDELSWLSQEVRDILGGETLETSGHRWSYLGPLLRRLFGYEELNQFIIKAVENVIKTEKVFRHYIKKAELPRFIFGGGAVREDNLWSLLCVELQKQGVENIIRVQGEPAVGLARFAAFNPNSDAWSFIGYKRPSWL